MTCPRMVRTPIAAAADADRAAPTLFKPNTPELVRASGATGKRVCNRMTAPCQIVIVRPFAGCSPSCTGKYPGDAVLMIAARFKRSHPARAVVEFGSKELSDWPPGVEIFQWILAQVENGACSATGLLLQSSTHTAAFSSTPCANTH